ncbi:sigma-70 family RNA polymerase sigma factor [Allobaculum sp. JKK-2023]|uniref:RNA polymerase sigma factor n=1 Tax=Allobaculum sp. JKK-2023 TaxID=3108943 RepID=UPI002B05DC45|nr:sigma-70 family RNA polymerase sigma factor [Allobaculum sp. JKK-2023]
MQLDTEYLMAKYQKNLYLAAYSVLQNQADAQDAVQSTFLKYYQKDMNFENEEHIRRWLFRTVLNQAKDIRRAFWRRNRVSIDQIQETAQHQDDQAHELFNVICSLPAQERMVLQLYYYENYSAPEMAEMLSISEAAVRKRLSRARQKLKEKLKGDWNDEQEE